MAADRAGLGQVTQTVIDLGLDVTGMAKQLAIKPFLLFIKKFINDDDTILSFIEQIFSASIVLPTTEQKLRLFVHGFFTCTGPKRNGDPQYNNDLFVCLVNGIVENYQNTSGKKLAETAKLILDVSDDLHATFRNADSTPPAVKGAAERFWDMMGLKKS